MSQKDMRLRLVVRREGLPEERLMWNISLEDDPTISKLLEKVNETLPLEIGQNGLEDYAVELHDEDGASFECLHFQSLRTVIKPDDRVFIRTLDRDDNKRRRLSGRHQISSDGRHLIDGVPFGRRLLRAPNGRPQINLPPRKRPRFTYDQDDNFEDEQDTPMLFLTNGERPDDATGFPDARVDGDFDDANVDDSENGADSDGVGGDPESDKGQESLDSLSDEDLDEEIQGLLDDNAALEEGRQKLSALQTAFPSAPVKVCETILESSGGDLKMAYNSLVGGFEPRLPESSLSAWSTSKDHIAIPTTSQSIPPATVTTSNPTKESPNAAMQDDEDPSETSDEEGDEEVSTLIRQFDHRGLPPGSITSGKGLAQMAAISGSFTNSKVSGESETTSATLNSSKASPEKTINEDDETSSDALSSSSEDEGFEAEGESGSDKDTSSNSNDNSDDSDDENHNDDLDGNSGDEDNGQGGSRGNASDVSSSQNDDSSEDEDSGPEERPTRTGLSASYQQMNMKGRELGYDNSSDVDTSSSDISEDSDVSSSEESDDESSEAESVPESEDSHLEETPALITHARTANPQQTRPSQAPLITAPQVKTIPPGAGKDSTRKRNARRRAANKAKRLEQQTTILTNAIPAKDEVQPLTPAILDEKALFEAKRQELLDAIANGGVEVGPSSTSGNSSNVSAATKRKHDAHNEPDYQDTQGRTPTDISVGEDTQSPASDQKRRRIDVGVGRRLLFGALGLRNPKSKEDEDKIRAKLMKDVRPLQNPRQEQTKNDARHVDGGDSGETIEGVDAWKEKIIYRAVECCHDEVELSEPPFPFVQRWDPQQQSQWYQKKNKRGGQSKRAQRNEAHFYQDSRSNKKRGFEESAMWDEEGYNDTFNGINDDTNADVELNYDDPEDDEHPEPTEPTNDASQFTDIDDLPSLPSDLSTLPILRPGEVQVGMVITWQQWSCSSATNWQPQLSNVAGVVVRIDDDATGLEVCLAKRDRYLDRNEKKYDENTGQRIYDKFEAPDLDDEDEGEGEDEGFRTIGFAEMQQPRILQQPLPAMANAEKPREHMNHPLQASLEPGTKTSPIMDDAQVSTNMEQPSSQEPTKEISSSIASSGSSQSGQGLGADDVSASDLSRISSPSRQLHESTSQAIIENSRKQPSQDISSRRDADSDASPDKIGHDVSDSGFPNAERSSAPLFDSYEDEVVAGTPRVVRPKFIAPPSSTSSARSGRQPDHTLDMDIAEPESFKATDDGVSIALDTENRSDSGSSEHTPTPTPKPIRQTMADVGQAKTDTKDDTRSALPGSPSTPSSLESLNTVWCTALTSRNTQSPSKSLTQSQSQSLPLTAKASQKTQDLKDQEYEDAMQKLDNLSDDQDSISRVPDSFKRSSIPRGLGNVTEDVNLAMEVPPKSPQIKPSPPPVKKEKPAKSSSQFTLPPGTQVIELSSDSEPNYTEDYADDEVDGNYSPEVDSFPTGNGWVHKKLGGKPRNTRSLTAPIKPEVARKKPLPLSQGRHSISPSMSTFSPIKPRRKTSSRF